jgi:L-ascorbate metabolism protein UlaG (beta-lactamase superfamily)
VEEALLVAEKIGAKVNIPTHYGMFESNTEDPAKFTDRVQGGFTMEHAVEYDMDEVLCGRR